MIDFNEILSAALVLFAVINVLGAIPLLIAIKNKTEIRPFLATAVTAGIMVGFLFLGETMLNIIGVDVGSFAVAGSIVMAFIAFEMILGIELFKEDDADAATASVVPLAFPLLAGAGSLTTILSIRAEYSKLNIVVAILLNMVIIYIVLKNLHHIQRLLGPVGTKVLNKVFGIILLAIAVKLFSSNAQLLFSA